MDDEVKQAMLELADRLVAISSYYANIGSQTSMSISAALIEVSTAIDDVFSDDDDYEDDDDAEP
jgi:hypothetical protein